MPGLSRDAETIALKCLEKTPARRYASAGELAEDLRRFIDDRPILARRQTHLERSLRWARRHPVIASVAGLLTAVLVVATAVSLLVAGRMAALADTNERFANSEHAANQTAQAARTKAEANRLEALTQRERAERNLYVSPIGQAESSLRLFDSATARALLDQCIRESDGPDRRGWEWFYLDRWCRPELRTVSLHPPDSETSVVAVSPDGRLVVVGCAAVFPAQYVRNPVVPTYVIDVKDGKIRHDLRAGNKTFVLAVAFRPDSKRFATAGNEQSIKVWESDTCRLVWNLSGLAAPVQSLAWSPDGQRLASADEHGLVQIWDPETGHERGRIPHSALHVAWSPDGTRIATVGAGNQVCIWLAADGQPSGSILGLGGERGICWAPDARRLAGVANDGSLAVWDTGSGQMLFTVKHADELWSVAFSPDGNRLATGGKEGIIRVHDAGSGRERAHLFTGSMNVSSLAFHPDGRRLFAAGWGLGGVKIFDAERDPRGRGVAPWLDQLTALAFVGDSQTLHAIGWDGGHLASLAFSAGGIRYERNFPVTHSAAWPRGDFAFSVDGRRLAAPLLRDRAVVGIWDVGIGRLAATIRGNSALVTALAFSPDGFRLATGVFDSSRQRSVVTKWDIASGRPVLTFDGGLSTVDAVTFACDGRKIAASGAGGTGGGPGWVTVWDAETGAALGAQDCSGRALAFHPDGTLLAIADRGSSSVHLWDLSWGTLITRPGPEAVSCVAFTPDGKRLASLGKDGSVHLADARTLEQVLVLRSLGPSGGSGGWTPRLAFSADGSCIAAHRAHFLNLWEAGPVFDPQIEPKPDDIAGWLHRSRVFAGQGDETRALAAWERGRAIPTDLPEPWIEHGLAQGVEPQQAELAFATAFSARCDDPMRWLVCARELERSVWKREAGIALAKARAFAQKRLSIAPDDEPTAWVLADLMIDGMTALPDGRWVILRPSEMTSAGGVTLTRLPDGSILVGGNQPYRDSVTLVARTELTGITGLRLEVLPDPSLPSNGPGRFYEYGDLHLSELSASIAPGEDRSRTRAILFVEAVATDVRKERPLERPLGVIDGNPLTGWEVRGQIGLRNAIALTTAAPVDTPAGSTWIIRIDCHDTRMKQGTLGRFRLSVTNGPVTLFETSLHKTLTEPEWNGRTRLGVVRYLLEDWQAAALALRIAVDSSEGAGIDRFLLALALHHLDRHDEARRNLESGVDWLRANKPSGILRTVVVEAIAEIEGISRSQADARMFLDPIFPAEAFAR